MKNTTVLLICAVFATISCQKKLTPAQTQQAPPKNPLITQTDSISYGLGLLVATNLKDQGIDTLNIDAFEMALNNVYKDTTHLLTQEQANQMLMQFMQQKEAEKQAKEKEKYKGKITEGEAFLAENKTKEGVQETPSGLQYKIIEPGDGQTPTPNSTVKAHYHGTLLNGEVFDSSIDRGEPIEFPLNQVIPGWTEALQLIKEGGKMKVWIPYNLAYGERAAGELIKPYSTLVFDIELIEVLD